MIKGKISFWVADSGIILLRLQYAAEGAFLQHNYLPDVTRLMNEVPLERSTKGIVVASLHIVCYIPISANLPSAAIFLYLIMDLTVFLV